MISTDFDLKVKFNKNPGNGMGRSDASHTLVR